MSALLKILVPWYNAYKGYKRLQKVGLLKHRLSNDSSQHRNAVRAFTKLLKGNACL